MGDYFGQRVKRGVRWTAILISDRPLFVLSPSDGFNTLVEAEVSKFNLYYLKGTGLM